MKIAAPGVLKAATSLWRQDPNRRLFTEDRSRPEPQTGCGLGSPGSSVVGQPKINKSFPSHSLAQCDHEVTAVTVSLL